MYFEKYKIETRQIDRRKTLSIASLKNFYEGNDKGYLNFPKLHYNCLRKIQFLPVITTTC